MMGKRLHVNLATILTKFSRSQNGGGAINWFDDRVNIVAVWYIDDYVDTFAAN